MSGMSSAGVIDSTRVTYFSPDSDTTDAFLAFIDTAKKKIRIADYSFNLDPLVQKLIAKHQAGLDVQLVLDRSQSKGTTEVPEVAKLRAAGVPLVIGTSEMRQIMHLKFTILDDEWVENGSWNYTGAASKEDNVIDVEHSPDRATVFNQKWEKMKAWILANEPQN